MTEHEAQVALFEWAESHSATLPPLRCLFAIPNGLRTYGIGAAVKAKREGLKKGVPDLFLAYPAKPHHGLFIELKKESVRPKRNGAGGVRAEQKEWHERLEKSGYRVRVCYGVEDAIGAIKEYLA